jgi:hypothetical protein
MRMFSARSTLLVLTGTWIIAAGVYSYPEMRDDIEQVIRFRQLAAAHPPVIPARCSEGHAKASPALIRQDSNSTHCWMELSSFERLYPEVAAVTDEDASARVIMAAGEVLENRVEALEDELWDAATLALIPPLIVGLGFLLWSYRRRLTPLWTWGTRAARVAP